MQITQQWFKWLAEYDRQSTWDQIGHAAAIAIAFAIPVSTSATSALSILIFVAWLMGPHRNEKWLILRGHPLLIWLYPLILIALVGAFYSDAEPRALRQGFTDALRLVLMPLLFYFYRSEKIATAALWAFIAAMVLTLGLAFLKVYADFPIGLKFTTGAVFKSHIKSGYFMGMAAFFLALKLPAFPKYRSVIVFLIAAMVYYLFFMNLGRIGYITVLSCGGILAWQAYRMKGLYIAGILGLLLLGGAYAFSDIFYHRMQHLVHEFEIYQKGGDLLSSSLGSRISFIIDSITLMKSHPLIGYGTGSFGAAYGTLPEMASRLFTDNPHNEFLRIGVEFGVIGMLLLGLFFYQQGRLSQQLSPSLHHLWQGTYITFILGCLLNSWMRDVPEAYFYCVMTAICFAQVPVNALITQRKVVHH